jgi:hypothetical protein
MIRLVLVASLLAGCRISLETAADASSGGDGGTCAVSTTAPCVAATTHSDLAWIEQNIFTPSCAFSGCHDSPTDLGKLDLRTGMSHATLVGTMSKLETTRMLVVPNNVQASYLMLMLHDFDPAMASPPGTAPGVGYMPQGAPELCCQKLQAIERWIMAGAPTN